MTTLSRDQVAAALTTILRDTLGERKEVHVPGLGTFRVHHEISRVTENEDGSIEMRPPRDVIAFSPQA